MTLNKLSGVRRWLEREKAPLSSLELFLISFISFVLLLGVSTRQHPEESSSLSEAGRLLVEIAALAYAVGAQKEARIGWEKAQQILDTIGSSHDSFSEVLNQAIIVVQQAHKELHILLPTLPYGFLYDQTKRSTAFLRALRSAIDERKVRLTWYVPLADQSDQSIGQIYLRKAFESGLAEDYLKELKEIFSVLSSMEGDRLTLVPIRMDPHIRVVVADPYAVQEEEAISLQPIVSLAMLACGGDSDERDFTAYGLSGARHEFRKALLAVLEEYRRAAGDLTYAEKRELLEELTLSYSFPSRT